MTGSGSSTRAGWWRRAANASWSPRSVSGTASGSRQPVRWATTRSARFYEITNKEGASVGNYFTAREGAKVYSLIIAGFYTEDREIWVEMIGDKLERFSAYTP